MNVDVDTLRRGAEAVLRGNDRGRMTVAAPLLYPHQWSWDAAFVAIGLAHLSVERACAELEHLLAGQWRTGMIPHIVFDPDQRHDGTPGPRGYFPGPDRWGCADLSDDAPRHPATSGICQPPAHAIAVASIAETAARRGRAERDQAVRFAATSWPALIAWHRWLVDVRRSPTTGLIAVVHGWESGMDNSPRFDEPYSRVSVGAVLPPYRRSDLETVTDASQRPSHEEYDRYLWLIEEMRAVRYDAHEVVRASSFLVGDVFITALLAVACDVLAALGAELAVGDAGERTWLRATADELRTAVTASVDAASGLALDVDERTGQRIAVATIAGFAPLLCGGLAGDAEAAMLALFEGPAWCGHPGLVARVPPSTSPQSAAFEPRRYWRGPTWPVINWLFGWALARRGHGALAATLRDESLAVLADGDFGEYYEPFTGECLGSAEQSWTAAVTLDWLA